jgi:hypothetical protein
METLLHVLLVDLRTFYATRQREKEQGRRTNWHELRTIAQRELSAKQLCDKDGAIQIVDEGGRDRLGLLGKASCCPFAASLYGSVPACLPASVHASPPASLHVCMLTCPPACLPVHNCSFQ